MACAGDHACAPLCARCRHSLGALSVARECVRYKPAAPWAPEAARRVFSSMLAAVRAPPLPSGCSEESGPPTCRPTLSDAGYPFCLACTARVGRARALGGGGAGQAPTARPGLSGRRTLLDPRVGGDQQSRRPGHGSRDDMHDSRDGVAVDTAARGLRAPSQRRTCCGKARGWWHWAVRVWQACGAGATAPLLPQPRRHWLLVAVDAWTLMRHSAVAARQPAGISTRSRSRSVRGARPAAGPCVLRSPTWPIVRALAMGGFPPACFGNALRSARVRQGAQCLFCVRRAASHRGVAHRARIAHRREAARRPPPAEAFSVCIPLPATRGASSRVLTVMLVLAPAPAREASEEGS